MTTKIIIFILIFFVNFHSGWTQILACGYRNTTLGYTCDLLLYNPSGTYNFSRISGTHLPGKTNEDVLYIRRTEDSNSTIIPSIICDTFQNATIIELSTMGIQYFDENVFKNCKKLYHLNLNSNKIIKLEENSFNENLDLQELHLYRSRLTTLPENIFKNNKKIITLDLRFNLIEDLPRNIFRTITQASTLYLHDNKLKVIHAFGFSSRLTTVQLQNNQIEAFDQNFIDETGVNLLDMRNNLCANVSINDTSPSRLQMRMLLVKCFDNYMNLPQETTTTSITSSSSTTEMTLPPECNDGDIDERVCRLEIENKELKMNVESQSKAFEELETRMTNMENRPCACKSNL